MESAGTPGSPAEASPLQCALGVDSSAGEPLQAFEQEDDVKENT